ncbi:MAG: hypothetical protein A4E34_02032 [Methanoregula sp. PtaU1.Bin006]|nr:MAG: hypothetical protein A4E33_00821 [Methanoregula sp. PtaB.Bin085]OPY33327.1 MAG: hypothetical protein A4E34_02032 [Methanoregula sp. PtaU1.Bin006]
MLRYGWSERRAVPGFLLIRNHRTYPSDKHENLDDAGTGKREIPVYHAERKGIRVLRGAAHLPLSTRNTFFESCGFLMPEYDSI